MMIPIDAVTNAITALLEVVKVWRDKKALSENDKSRMNEAVGKVMKAAMATKAYLYDARELGKPSRENEHELSLAWQEAATAIRSYDENLFIYSQVKSLGWADPREWEKVEHKSVTVNLDLIIKQCEWHRDQLQH